MNMKKTSFNRLLPKIALLVAIVIVMVCVLSSCGNQTVIDTKKTLAEWSQDPDPINIELEKNWLGSILYGIGQFLKWITKGMPANSYILTLFVFAVVMEIVLVPFSIKQHKNSIRQAKLKPFEMAIRKKYAGRNDQATQQKVTAEIQELYQKENFNPMSGCLPLLIQLPILIVLYRIVVDPMQFMLGLHGDVTGILYTYITSSTQDGGLGYTLQGSTSSIEVLSKVKDIIAEKGIVAFDGIKNCCQNGNAVFEAVQRIDNTAIDFSIGQVNFGTTVKSAFELGGVNLWLIAVPVLTFLSYFFSMRINRKLTFQPTQSANDRQQACSNNMMDITMPLMSVWMTFIVPAAVGVYWIFKSIIGVGKQFILSKVMPMPKFTEDDYKAAEKDMLGKQPKKIQKSENVGKVRSLHHIDDEDYDEKGNYAPKTANEKPTTEEEKIEKLPENKMTEGATLKDESDKKN